MRGYVELVDQIGQGAFLTADALAGATTLLVTQGEQFAAEGCSAVLAGGTYPVTGVESGAYEDDPDVVHLATALSTGVEAGEPVRVTPGTDYTTATVVLAADGAVLEGVEIRQDLQSKIELQPGAYEGDARPIVDVELVDDQHVITNVDGRGEDDGSNIAPGTLPPVEVVPVAPLTSPAVRLPLGGPGSIVLRWFEVEDQGQAGVTYDVHDVTDSGDVADDTNLVDSVKSLSWFLSPANGVRRYRLWARSGDLKAPEPSDVIVAGPAVDAEDVLAVGGVYAEEFIQVGSDTGAHMGIYDGVGLAGYGPDGRLMTQLDPATGRLDTEDAAIRGTITGSTIAISQGVISEVTETFGSNTTPAGWTRSDLYAPATAMRFDSGRAVLDPSALPQGFPFGGVLLKHNDFNAQNVILRFDVYTPAGGQGAVDSSTYAPRGGIAVRAIDGDYTFAGGTIGLHFGQSAMWLRNFKVIDLPGDAWSRVEVQLLGSTIRVRRLVLGTDNPASPWITYGLLLPVATGGLTVFTVIDNSSGTRPVARLDNIKAQHVPAGFYVDADGKVGVDHLEIFQSVRVPDPVAGGSSFQGANVHYVDQTRGYSSATSGDTGAFTGTTHRQQASLGFVSAGTAAIYVVQLDIDVSMGTSSAAENRYGIKVDGNATGPGIVTSSASAIRVSGSRTYFLSNLAAGSHTLTSYTFSASGTTRSYRSDISIRRIA